MRSLLGAVASLMLPPMVTRDPTPSWTADEARRELLELSTALRAHLDYLMGSGAHGLPTRPTGAITAHDPAAAHASRGSPPVATALPSTTLPSTTLPSATLPSTTLPSTTLPSAALPSAAPSPPLPVGPEARLVEHHPPAALAALAAEEPGRGSQHQHPRLLVLQEEARACTRCALHATRTQSVFSRGHGTSGLVFVGEGPGEEEDKTGFPFVGAAGQLLDKMIAAMKLGRDEVYVCNIVKCRPPKNRKPDPDEMSKCMPFLAEQLTLLNPRVIVALGATAVQGLLGTTEGIMRLRGQWKLYRGRIPVMPTFHPAYLLRQPGAKREVWQDLQEVMRQLGSPDTRTPH